MTMFGLVLLELVETGVPLPGIKEVSSHEGDGRVFPAEADAIQAFHTFIWELGLPKLLPLSVNLW